MAVFFLSPILILLPAQQSNTKNGDYLRYLSSPFKQVFIGSLFDPGTLFNN